MSQQPPTGQVPPVPGTTGGLPVAVNQQAAAGGPKPPRRRRWWIIGGVVVILVAGGGVAWWLWPAGSHTVPGTVQASVLSADEAGQALGQTLASQHGISQPPPPLPSDPANCAVAVGPATQAVYTPGWTTFGSVTYQDSDAAADHTVTQVIGVYPTTDQARQVFGTLSDGLKRCKSAVRGNVGGDNQGSKWVYAVDKATGDTVTWKATQDAGDGWACYRQARLKNKAVVEVAVCEAGDGSGAAASIAGQVAGRAGGLQ